MATFSIICQYFYPNAAFEMSIVLRIFIQVYIQTTLELLEKHAAFKYYIFREVRIRYID